MTAIAIMLCIYHLFRSFTDCNEFKKRIQKNDLCLCVLRRYCGIACWKNML